MTIALVAHDTKKELMVQFCIAYRHILSNHHLIATGTTGRLVADATGLPIQRFLPGGHGGVVELDGEKVGAYRDETGELFLVSTRCPHLG